MLVALHRLLVEKGYTQHSVAYVVAPCLWHAMNSNSHYDITDSTHSLLAIDAIHKQYSESFIATKTKAHWISFDQCFLSLVLPL